MVDFKSYKSITIPEGSVKKITSGGVVLWEKATGRLPSEYQEVEYIASDNRYCAIVSDILYDNHTSTGLIVSAKISPFYIAPGENDYNNFCAMYPPAKLWFGIRNGYYATSQRSNWLKSSVKATVNEIIEIEGRVSADYNGYLKVNGETILSGLRNYPDLNFSNAYLFLCGYNYEGNLPSNTGWMGSCYWCVVKDINGNILGDFVPCYRKSDGEIGLYNLITDTFCTKIGTGSFTKGANI